MNPGVRGVKETNEILTRLPREIERRVVRAALLKGARIVAARIRAMAPFEEGNIKKNVRARLATASEVAKLQGLKTRSAIRGFSRSGAFQQSLPIALAGVGKRGWYARLIEYGWWLSKHRKVIGTKASGKPQKAKSERIKFIPARPFIRPAYEATKHEAASAISVELDKGVREAARALSGEYRTSGFSKRGRTFIG